LKSYDKNNTGFITFLQLRKILDSIKINLKDELIEYLIYLMKDFKHETSTSLEDLKYANIVSLIPEGDLPENSKITEQSSIHEDEEEIHIKSEDFHRIFNGIMKKLADFLLFNHTNIRTFFKNIIYTHELSEKESYEAINLQIFLKELKKVDVNVETIAMYCLFEKLKFSEQVESIDVKKLVDEVKLYGVSENKNEDNSRNEEFFYKIGKFLKEKNLKLIDFLEAKIVKVDIGNEKKDCISVHSLTQTLIQNDIVSDPDILGNILKLFVTDDHEHVLIEKFKSSLEYYYKKAMKNKDKYDKKEVSNKNINIDDLDANDIPNADSKVFSDTLKSEKQFEEEKLKLIQMEKQNEAKKYEEEMDFIQELSHEETSRSKQPHLI